MNCPHCQKTLPPDFSTSCCPFCQRDLNISQNKIEGSKLVLYLLVILPGILMFVLPQFFSELMKPRAHGDNFGNKILGFLVAAIIGFLISLYTATRFVRKENQSDAYILKTFGLAILIMFANLGIAFVGCSLLK